MTDIILDDIYLVSRITWTDTPMGLKVAETPITQAQWVKVMGRDTEPEKQWETYDPLLPATHVNWYEAMEFAKKVGGRLPSSEEFHLLTFAGQEKMLEPIEEYAVFNQRAICPVRTKKPNDWGLYDTTGLVWEWCQDGEGDWKWVRGGSWFNNGHYCRSAYRIIITPDTRINDIGFRVVVSEGGGK
jgi:formylglycine-generating enzyme required for sulfatase activity